MRWLLFPIVWTKFRPRTPCRVLFIRIWQRYTKRRCSSRQEVPLPLLRWLPWVAAILHMLFLIIRVTSPKVSCSCVVTAISVKLSLTRSVRCLVWNSWWVVRRLVRTIRRWWMPQSVCMLMLPMPRQRWKTVSTWLTMTSVLWLSLRITQINCWLLMWT